MGQASPHDLRDVVVQQANFSSGKKDQNPRLQCLARTAWILARSELDEFPNTAF
jgi:hypothetical protein